jgi:hypothetical protein
MEAPFADLQRMLRRGTSMRHASRRPVVILAMMMCLSLSVLLAAAAPSAADSVYPSQHIALMPVDGAPLASGFIQNIHANGPQVFAQERYVLVGAAPDTQYQATIQIYGDPGATVWMAAMPTVAFTTNGAGNGVGRFTLAPSGVPEAFHGMTLYLVWELTTGGAVAYQTPLSPVVLD